MRTIGAKISNSLYEKVKKIGKPSDVLRAALNLYLKNLKVNHSDDTVNQRNKCSDINSIRRAVNGLESLKSNSDKVDEENR